MPKYLLQASYTTEGMQGVINEGGSKRCAAVEQVLKELGGTLEGFYFAFGDTDAYIICEMPDNVTITAASLAVNASGAVKWKTTALLTAAEVDQATHMTVHFRAPVQ